MESVPQQDSSCGKRVLLGISKRSDCYLRPLLIHFTARGQPSWLPGEKLAASMKGG
jgi:hypothetical protein